MISQDAIIFGMAYLRSPKATLSFGGEGAEMRITSRARAALNELVEAGFAESIPAEDQIPEREWFCGKGELWKVARESGFNPFSDFNRWPTFVKIHPAVKRTTKDTYTIESSEDTLS